MLTSEGHYKDKLNIMKDLAQSLASSNCKNVSFVIKYWKQRSKEPILSVKRKAGGWTQHGAL